MLAIYHVADGFMKPAFPEKLLFPSLARAEAKLIEVVVLPTPPFWLVTAMIFCIGVVALILVLYSI